LGNGGADLRQLGLGEVDVRVEQPAERVARCAELGTDAGWRFLGGIRLGWCRVRTLSGVAGRVERTGRVLRIVQGSGSLLGCGRARSSRNARAGS
jgi:hypothetical protein